jgi:AraC-like DNA-binding protein
MRDLVERIAVERSILRVDDIVRASDLDTRALQRCFRTYVGISPKSVIQRYRLHEGGDPTTRAESAFARRARGVFKRTVGQTPRAFSTERA